MALPRISQSIPHLTTEQMIEVDRLMIDEYHIELIQMMENAGRCLALIARDSFFSGNPIGKQVMVLAGTGGNGGGTMVAARRLQAWGANIQVFVTNPGKMTPIPGHQMDILQRMNIPILNINQLPKIKDAKNVDLILDGIIGYSLTGNPHGPAKAMIEWANAHPAPILALDTPSGISLTTGTIYEPAIRAEATLTLALPKAGLFAKQVIPLRGNLFLGDISVPPDLYARPSLDLVVGPIFAESDVVAL